MTIRKSAGLLLPLVLWACAAPTAERASSAAVVTVGIAAFNDFHGNLEPPRQAVQAPDGSGATIAIPAGGAAWLASAIDAVRARYPNHLTVSAGDLVGASPISSALFLDEPAIGAMNRIGLDFNAVGNHEFDNGIDELRRKQNGGCRQFTRRQPCQAETFAGARFTFLAANVRLNDGSTLFPASAMRAFGKGRSRVRIGVIGMTLQETRQLVSPDGVKDVTFADEADTANALVARLKAQGADAVILLLHQGGRTSGAPDPNGCEGFVGDIRLILDRLDPGVDVVVSGHTHQAYVCDWSKTDAARPFLLTSAGLYGEEVTEIALDIDPRLHRVAAKRAHNIVVQSPAYRSSHGTVANSDLFPVFTPRDDIAAYVARYTDAAKAYAQRKVGALTAPALKTEGDPSGGPLGNLIADAQLAATKDAGAQIALTNPFGIRHSLVPAADGSLTFADIYAVQPFLNTLVTLSLTGAELKTVLEQGLDDAGPEQLLSPSAGFSYVYDRSARAGSRIMSMVLNGVRIEPTQTYRVTVNSFLAGGGDTFALFTRGKNQVVGMSDIDALEAWVGATPPRTPSTDPRVLDVAAVTTH